MVELLAAVDQREVIFIILTIHILLLMLLIILISILIILLLITWYAVHNYYANGSKELVGYGGHDDKWWEIWKSMTLLFFQGHLPSTGHKWWHQQSTSSIRKVSWDNLTWLDLTSYFFLAPQYHFKGTRTTEEGRPLNVPNLKKSQRCQPMISF